MFNKLKAFFKPSFKLTFYMKSGNTVELTHVTDWEMKVSGDDITSLNLTQKHKGTRLIVNSINLSQIEAVTRHY